MTLWHVVVFACGFIAAIVGSRAAGATRSRPLRMPPAPLVHIAGRIPAPGEIARQCCKRCGYVLREPSGPKDRGWFNPGDKVRVVEHLGGGSSIVESTSAQPAAAECVPAPPPPDPPRAPRRERGS